MRPPASTYSRKREARGKPVPQAALRDLRALAEDERRLQYEQRLGAGPHHGTEHALEVVWRISQLHRLEFETRRSVCRLHLLELVARQRIGKDGDAANLGQHLLEQPEPFGRQLTVLKEAHRPDKRPLLRLPPSPAEANTRRRGVGRPGGGVDHPADLAPTALGHADDETGAPDLAHGSNLLPRSYTSGCVRLVAPSMKKA